MITYMKDNKVDPGNYRPDTLTSVLRNVMEQIILRATSWLNQAWPAQIYEWQVQSD